MGCLLHVWRDVVVASLDSATTPYSKAVLCIFDVCHRARHIHLHSIESLQDSVRSIVVFAVGLQAMNKNLKLPTENKVSEPGTCRSLP